MTRILVILAAILASVVVGSRQLSDPDLPMHLATGKVLATLGRIPEHDVLAFTGRPILYVEVVSERLLYGIEQASGPVGLQVFAGLCTFGIASLVWLRTRRSGPVAYVVTALVIASMGPWLIARPATFAFLLLALVLWLVDVHRQHPGTKPGRWALVGLVATHALFANVHGFVVLACAISAGYGLYRVVALFLADRVGEWLPARDGRDAINALLAGVGSVCASALNPAGFLLLSGPGTALRDHSRISEWRPPTLGILLDFAPAALVLALVLGLVLVLGRQPNGERALPVFDLGLVLGGVALASSAVRLIPIAALLSAPVIAERLAPFVREQSRNLAAGAALLSAPVLAIDSGFTHGRGFSLSSYPEGAVQFVETNHLSGRMWNHLPYGGWLMWRLYPRWQVMVDGRTGWVHDPAFIDRAIQSETDPIALESLAEELGLGFAVTRATEGLPFGRGLASAPRWQLVFLDDNSAVYVRREHALTDGYRFIRHDVDRRELLALALQPTAPADALLHDAELALAQAPQSGRSAVLLGAAGIASNDRLALDRAKGLLGNEPAWQNELESAWNLARRSR